MTLLADLTWPEAARLAAEGALHPAQQAFLDECCSDLPFDCIDRMACGNNFPLHLGHSDAANGIHADRLCQLRRPEDRDSQHIIDADLLSNAGGSGDLGNAPHAGCE